MRKSHSQQQGKWVAEKIKDGKPSGICSNFPNCKKATDSKRKTCSHCLSVLSARRNRRRQSSPSGKCIGYYCKNPADSGFCRKCLDIANASNAAVKADVFIAYGNKCACCGESEPSFLSIDHVNGYDGTGPRKSVALYRWLKRRGNPDGFQLLCMNCNASRGYYGYCPHCPDAIANHDKYGKDRSKAFARKRYIFDAYGGCVCACCDERMIEFLCLDHVNGGGTRHREAVGFGSKFYNWIEQSEFPSGFQVLCINCNFSKGDGGRCLRHACDAV